MMMAIEHFYRTSENVSSNPLPTFSIFFLNISTSLFAWKNYLPSQWIKPGARPMQILQRKSYALWIFKHSDWLKNLGSQSKYLKNSVG